MACALGVALLASPLLLGSVSVHAAEVTPPQISVGEAIRRFPTVADPGRDDEARSHQRRRPASSG